MCVCNFVCVCVRERGGVCACVYVCAYMYVCLCVCVQVGEISKKAQAAAMARGQKEPGSLMLTMIVRISF